ncbi:unnamed protein product [Enterobius vermicularis]|uniref:PUM-HD domain-containing protein n=1 Tax=Enterobius vermicularis TaxID=51028 RepID=A0A0N4UZL6_ENTVE|nr:unnamed protein product [Enterobius vermicularis]
MKSFIKVFLQKIFKCAPFESYEFILKAFVLSSSTLETIVEDKYGCRVVQLVLQRSFCLIGSFCSTNLLSLSQEKHASHVVEKAFHSAPEPVLSTMMHEVFEGYECDRDGNDALNVLMFDQYGNYVVQTMIDVALEVKQGIRKGKVEWYNRLVERVNVQQTRLLNFSSGKRIISKLVEVKFKVVKL